jgi:hypothetical protein
MEFALKNLDKLFIKIKECKPENKIFYLEKRIKMIMFHKN